MTFKEWLKLDENGTSTSCVAVFARMSFPLVRRGNYDDLHLGGNPHKKKKKKKKHHQADDDGQPGLAD